MAHTKAQSSSKNHGRTAGKRLGLKKTDGQQVFAGEILVRQRGTVWRGGDGIGVGKDFTLFALRDGILRFRKASREQFNSARRERTFLFLEAAS